MDRTHGDQARITGQMRFPENSKSNGQSDLSIRVRAAISCVELLAGDLTLIHSYKALTSEPHGIYRELVSLPGKADYATPVFSDRKCSFAIAFAPKS